MRAALFVIGGGIQKRRVPRCWLAMLGALACLTFAGPAAAGPPLKIEPAKLEAAFHCTGDITNASSEPIMLSTGTLGTGTGLYAFLKRAFDAYGHPVCWVDYPDLTTADVQDSVQYLVTLTFEGLPGGGQTQSPKIPDVPSLTIGPLSDKLLTVEKHRGGQIREIQREFERLMAQEERRLTVELTTAYELSDDEARQIIGQIEQASGRPVDATRNVDSDLIGGIVLQAGSMRVDASVRGRLERLRRDLMIAR